MSEGRLLTISTKLCCNVTVELSIIMSPLEHALQSATCQKAFNLHRPDAIETLIDGLNVWSSLLACSGRYRVRGQNKAQQEHCSSTNCPPSHPSQRSYKPPLSGTPSTVSSKRRVIGLKRYSCRVRGACDQNATRDHEWCWPCLWNKCASNALRP